MDTRDVLAIFLRGALGARGRKRARRAARFISGQRGLLAAGTLVTAAGVAWGVYDSMAGPSGAGAAGAGAVVPPPIPGTAAGAAAPQAPSDAHMTPEEREFLRIIRLAVSAARADGTLAPEERALILRHAREAGIEHLVEPELAGSRPLAELVGGVTDAARRQDLYVLAFTIIRADESVSGAERVYLAQLAHQLELDATTAARLEQETAARIDAEAE